MKGSPGARNENESHYRPLCEYYHYLFALRVDKARARCYNVRYVNGILNISFCVHRRCALCARLYTQGVSVDERAGWHDFC